ncbi:type III secretion system export apparatus subunit SctU [Paraburkholderia humisilvae]|uniref:Yop proteins translocation protein U n=1 Tax=Paraburkholderia humisilvae TaxID=627669 RepID=A0A6J5ECX3_9BURK|nr:type III secretion system export apparatus subunit SctU [Paraburkholderia humisilvae]CAB3764338.1 Yop proteins translocation protein U [Paraburkholderia humisilvae]
MSDDKTEAPTEKKLRDAREEGQVSHSADFTSAVSMAVLVLLLAIGSSTLIALMKQLVSSPLSFAAGDRSGADLASHLYDIGIDTAECILPVACAAALGGMLASIGQVGFQITMKPVAPNLSNISPATGFKRIFATRSVIELAKMILKAAIVTTVMWFTIKSLIPLMVASLYQPPQELATSFWSLLLKLLIFATIVFFLIGAADVGIQKFFFLKRLRMSKDEVKREYKQSEGDPRLKAERKRLARELINSPPPASKVARADMVVVNPTHYAVAVRYAPDEHPLPRVIAKGTAEQAAILRRAARDAQVPIIGNPPVARALYQVGVDQPIPEELFEAVAAILRWVQSIGMKKNPSNESAH